MSEDPISKVYCVGNSKAIIRARWNNLYTFDQCRQVYDTGFNYNLRDFQSARYMLDHGIDLSSP